MGDLALEINDWPAMLQGQRAGALEAMALVERVMRSMQSPVLAFDPEGRLKLLNPAGERAFGLRDGNRARPLRRRSSKLEQLLRRGATTIVISLGGRPTSRRAGSSNGQAFVCAAFPIRCSCSLMSAPRCAKRSALRGRG